MTRTDRFLLAADALTRGDESLAFVPTRYLRLLLGFIRLLEKELEKR